MSNLLPIPPVSNTLLILFGIINIFLPGFGLMIAYCQVHPHIKSFFICGVLQLLLAFIVIGWIWAIVNGLFMILRAIQLMSDGNKGQVIQVAQPQVNTVQPVQQPIQGPPVIVAVDHQVA